MMILPGMESSAVVVEEGVEEEGRVGMIQTLAPDSLRRPTAIILPTPSIFPSLLSFPAILSTCSPDAEKVLLC